MVGGIVILDKTKGMPCHAWDRGGLYALHSYRIYYQPLSPKHTPAVFSDCPSPFLRREMVTGYKEFSRRETISTRLLRGNLVVAQKMGWLSAGGGGQTESE